ncbi:MAG TPA: helix-hairpin-helix domain-containing protein [Methylomirabilota bacterium]|nr:helix-hairpin-helix domain-containing protein [Methylomirabilota bacterium]
MKLDATKPRAGFILVGILVIVMLGSMVAMSLLFRVQGGESAAVAGAGGEQAWLVAMSGIEEAIKSARSVKPGSVEWRNDPARFKDRLVFDDGSDQWFFTIYSEPDIDSLEPVRHGLTDCASKLNLNKASREMLAKVPGFSQALLDAYLGPKSAAEGEVVPLTSIRSVFDTTERARPARLVALTELFQFRGFTPAVLFGEDANFNFALDANEDDAQTRTPLDNQDGKLDLGLRRYLTVASYEDNRLPISEGVRRVNINDAKDALPAVELPASLTNFIIALRTNSMQISHPVSLLDAKISVKDEKGNAVEVSSGIGKDDLDTVLKHFTCEADEQTPGLINVNTASAAVLATLPGLDDALAERIVSTRSAVSPERRETIAWVLTEGALEMEKFKVVAPYLTSRSLQFEFSVVGFAKPSGRFKSFEVIVDLAGGDGRVAHLRDLTRYGLPFGLESNSQPSGEPSSSPLAANAL